MGYPKDLDEYDELDLVKELLERLKLQEQGLCDYCRQSPTKPACRFPGRHKYKHEPKRNSIRSGRRVADHLRERFVALSRWWTQKR